MDGRGAGDREAAKGEGRSKSEREGREGGEKGKAQQKEAVF